MLFLFAHPREFQPLLKILPAPDAREFDSITAYSWNSNRGNHHLLPVGAKQAEINHRLDLLPPDWLKSGIMNVGTAGDLSNNLPPQTTFVARELISDSGESFPLPTKPLNKLKAGLKKRKIEFTSGQLLTACKPVLRPGKRKEKHQQFGAETVDLEALKIYRALQKRGHETNLAVLKIISDSFETKTFAEAKKRQESAIKKLAQIIESMLILC